MKRSIIILALLMVVASCSYKNEIGQLLFNNNNCAAPCLFGITPGLTSEADAKAIASGNDLFRNCQTYDYIAQNGPRGIECDSISMVFEQGFVVQIGYSLSDVSTEQAIKKYGPPDRVTVILGNLPETESKVKAGIWFDNIYTQITLPEVKGELYFIGQDTHIETITYYSEEKYNDIARKMKDAEGWQGYTSYIGKLP